MGESNWSLEETLLPALLQCFGIIFIGYILGRTKVLHSSAAKGLSFFVQYLSLPALIFTTVSTISFTQVKWEFIASVFVTKACIFICIVLLTILLTNPPHLGKAGIFAIAATQSNDFALGYPLLYSLYNNNKAEYPMYLYIIAPVQLLVLNTVGFVCLEIAKQNSKNCKRQRSYCFHVFKGTIVNPIVIATVIGLIWNVAVDHKMLPFFNSILQKFSAAFGATALLLVGQTMSVKSTTSNSQIYLNVVILVLTKILVLPIILQKFTVFMLQDSSQNEINDLSSFGFLYGTIPTAPSVYVFAMQYDESIDVITKTIIFSTLFSAPLMLSSATVISFSISQTGIENIPFYLSRTISFISSLNLFCCIWLLSLLFIGKRWHSISFTVTIHIVSAQLLTAIGGMLFFFSPTEHSYLFYIQYVITSGSTYATRMCTFFLAALLLIVQIKSWCFVLQFRRKIFISMTIVCFIVPYAIAATLIVHKVKKSYIPNYQLGSIQIITTSVITFLCLVGTVLCIILQHICFKEHNRNLTLSKEQCANCQNPSLKNDLDHQPSCRKFFSIEEMPVSSSQEISNDVEDLDRNFKKEVYKGESEHLICNDICEILCDSQSACSVEKRLQCAARVSEYISQQEMGTRLYTAESIFKHTILLIAISLAMTLSLTVCFAMLTRDDMNGIFIELEFFDVIANYSIGILCFFLFGLDKVYNVISSKWATLKTRVKLLYSTDNFEPVTICQKFMVHHYEKCKEIGKTKIINGTKYCDIFNITDLTEWLLETGVTDTKAEAEVYSQCLLEGKAIEGINEAGGSQDAPLFRFTY